MTLKSLLPKNVTLFAHETLDSTNSEAKRTVLAKDFSAPVLVTAETQTAGRGRCGHSFHSPRAGAFFSLLLPVTSISDAVSVTSAAAVATARAIQAVSGIETGIKWVNDLLWNGKKVAGILCESAVSNTGKPYVIVGIGINYAHQTFPPELAEIAGDLGLSEAEKAPLIAKTVENLLALFGTDAWLAEYRERSVVLGKEIRFFSGDVDRIGIAEGIDADGGLDVRLPDGGKTVLRSGEIHLRLTESEKR